MKVIKKVNKENEATIPLAYITSNEEISENVSEIIIDKRLERDTKSLA